MLRKMPYRTVNFDAKDASVGAAGGPFPICSPSCLNSTAPATLDEADSRTNTFKLMAPGAGRFITRAFHRRWQSNSEPDERIENVGERNHRTAVHTRYSRKGKPVPTKEGP